MPRIAIVCRDLRGLGGTTRTVVEHAALLKEAGWMTDCLAYRFDRKRLQAAGAKLRWVPGFPWGSWAKRRLFAALADRMSSGYDVVHGHGDNLEQDILSLHNCVHAAHEAVHGAPLPEKDSVGRLHAMQLKDLRFKLLICNSKQTAEDARRRFGVPENMIRVIYPGHDPRQFNASHARKLRAPARAQLGYRDDDCVIGLITSGDFEKRGVGLFLRALRELRRHGQNFKALIAGKEAKLGPYLRLVSELGLGEQVRFMPARTDVENFYHALDVYCHPALYEEFGQSVQEALACGLPVVVGRRVGAAELLAPGLEELVVRPDAVDLAAKLSGLCADAERRRRVGAAGPAGVVRNTWRTNFELTMATYDLVRSSEASRKR